MTTKKAHIVWDQKFMMIDFQMAWRTIFQGIRTFDGIRANHGTPIDPSDNQVKQRSKPMYLSGLNISRHRHWAVVI